MRLIVKTQNNRVKGGSLMQLNYVCIRALLLYFEANLKLNNHGLPEGIQIKKIDFSKDFPSFSPEEIHYSVKKAEWVQA